MPEENLRMALDTLKREERQAMGMATPTMKLKLYIWEGNGISDAYHDDGTLVILAESPEQARAIVRAGRAEYERKDRATTKAYHAATKRWKARAEKAYEAQVKQWADDKDPRSAGIPFYHWLHQTPEGRAWREKHPQPQYPPQPESYAHRGWDGYDRYTEKDITSRGLRGLDRDPDRTIDLTPLTTGGTQTIEPQVVAFNGGGYD